MNGLAKRKPRSTAKLPTRSAAAIRKSRGIKTLSKADDYISRFGDRLGLPQDLIKRSAQIYRAAFNSSLFLRKRIKDTVAATIYYTCRENRFPITAREVSEVTEVQRRNINRGYNTLLRFLGKEMPLPDMSSLIRSIASCLNLDSSVKKDCYKILRKINLSPQEITRNPSALAGAIIFVSCQNYGMTWITREEIAKFAKASEDAIGRRVKRVKRALGTA